MMQYVDLCYIFAQTTNSHIFLAIYEIHNSAEQQPTAKKVMYIHYCGSTYDILLL